MWSKSNIRFLLIALVAFVLPISKQFLPITVVIYVVFWLVEGDFSGKLDRFKKNKTALLFMSFYVLHLIGMLYTDNLAFGWFDLEIKLSLFLFPLTFACSEKLSSHQLKGVLQAFIAGCTIALIYCLGQAYMVYQISQSIEEFFYLKLSVLHHPGYIAMYFVFSIAILIYWMVEEGNKKIIYNVVLAFLSLFLLGGVILLSAKSGILSLGVLFLVSLGFLLIVKRSYLRSFILLTSVIGLLILAFNYSTLTKERLQAAWSVFSADRSELQGSSVESTTVRLIIWPEALALFHENPVIGVGTGDIKDELLKKYEIKGYTGVLERRSNAHNQYLQTMATLGIFGIASLIMGFLLSFVKVFKRRHFIYLMFLFVIMQNALTESILEVQAGIIFFAFFNSLFMFLEPDEEQMQ